ncbi:MAG: hypothetical protein FD177_55 [Desulfovibrionaceae bacterium]|nr:MAG: hypothetical protein FD177_55 [Desulfovibrionaceae bacterium]
MSAAQVIESMGASVSLVGGKLKLAGLDRLDRDTAARVLDVARARRAEIVAELGGLVAPVPADTSPLEALTRFERDPRGVVAWLAQQGQGQAQYLVPRWAAAIRAEARLRVEESEGGADHARA